MTPEVDREIDRLLQYVTTLESSLPPSAWDDREISAYVPTRYRVCAYSGSDAVDVPYQALRDPSGVLSEMLPAPVAELLGGIPAAPSDDDGFPGTCTELTTEDTRALVAGLADAGVTYSWQIPRLHYGAHSSLLSSSVYIDVAPVLPDGEPPMEWPA
jgi:hypothetical protein